MINVYLPCVGTRDRLLIIQDLLEDIWSWRERFPFCDCILAGDLNSFLDRSDSVSDYINSFMLKGLLLRCDLLSGKAGDFTYINESLNQRSIIDYILISSAEKLLDFDVVDIENNFSDHLPIMATISFTHSDQLDPSLNSNIHFTKPTQLRWDHADLMSYYSFTGVYLQPVLAELDNVISAWNNNCLEVDYHSTIDRIYDDVVSILMTCAKQFVPQRYKGFYKFWWDQTLQQLKLESIDSDKIWKAAGRPRHGPIFDKRQSCRLSYRRYYRESEKASVNVYTNALNNALLQKDGPSFWKCWRAKFEAPNSCQQVGGVVDSAEIAKNFADHFAKAYTCNNLYRAEVLKLKYLETRPDYSGSPLFVEQLFDAELLGNIIYC